MNFCEDSSSGLEAKRKELLIARLHGHDTHFIRRIQACSGDGQYASASPRSPLTAPCQHGWGGAHSLRHASEGEGPSREASPLCSTQKHALGADTRAPATRRRACGTTGRGAGRYLLVPAALRTPGRRAWGGSHTLHSPASLKQVQPATGLQAVTRGYWGSTSTYGHTHTHITHACGCMIPATGSLQPLRQAPGRTGGSGHSWRTAHGYTRADSTAFCKPLLLCSCLGIWKPGGDDNQASHEGHSHT